MDDQQLDAKCGAWVIWCGSKGILAPKVKGNVLGRFQPSRVRPEPDAELSQELAFFNQAIHGLAENEPDSIDLQCFVRLWVNSDKRKAIAIDLEVAQSTVTYRARRFAREAVRMGKILRRVQTDEQYGQRQEVAVVD